MYTVHKVGNSKKGPIELKFFVHIALMIYKLAILIMYWMMLSLSFYNLMKGDLLTYNIIQ